MSFKVVEAQGFVCFGKLLSPSLPLERSITQWWNTFTEVLYFPFWHYTLNVYSNKSQSQILHVLHHYYCLVAFNRYFAALDNYYKNIINLLSPHPLLLQFSYSKVDDLQAHIARHNTLWAFRKFVFRKFWFFLFFFFFYFLLFVMELYWIRASRKCLQCQYSSQSGFHGLSRFKSVTLTSYKCCTLSTKS